MDFNLLYSCLWPALPSQRAKCCQKLRTCSHERIHKGTCSPTYDKKKRENLWQISASSSVLLSLWGPWSSKSCSSSKSIGLSGSWLSFNCVNTMYRGRIGGCEAWKVFRHVNDIIYDIIHDNYDIIKDLKYVSCMISCMLSCMILLKKKWYLA